MVFRGDGTGREFIEFWLDGSARVLAGVNVNIWEGLDGIKALVRGGQPLDAARLADVDTPLGEVGG